MISVIIPVYKVEQGICRCIDSVLAQSYQDWELLLIDDGSPDKSGAICDEYATKDARIKAFHKPNGGVSSARNLGIDNAKGEWLVFIDGDDMIAKHYLQEVAAHGTHDLLVFGLATDRYAPNGKLHASSTALLPNIYTNDCQRLDEDYSCILNSLNMESSCCKAYKRTIIEEHHIRFDTQMICFEDFDFVIRYLMHCKGSFCALPYIAYHYIQELSYNPIQRRNNRDLSPSVLILLQHLTQWMPPNRLSKFSQDTYFHILADKYRLLLNQAKGFGYTEAKRIMYQVAHDDIYLRYKKEVHARGGFMFRAAMKFYSLGLSYIAYIINKKRR